LMGEHGLLAPSRVGSPKGPRNHAGTIIPDRVDAMWGTDLTTTWTGEGQAAVFIAVDHHSAARLGIHAARRPTRSEALAPLRQAAPPPAQPAASGGMPAGAPPRSAPSIFYPRPWPRRLQSGVSDAEGGTRRVRQARPPSA